MKSTDTHFISYDLNLTTSMLALGHKLDKIEKQTNGRALFFLERSNLLKEHILLFWKKELSINVHDLFDSLKFIKSRIYSQTID